MVKRNGKRRWRRVLILALFLLIPTLLSDLPLFSKTGHGHGNAPAAGQPGGGGLALLPVAPGTLGIGHGRRHWHASNAGGDLYDGQGDTPNARDALLHNLVYLTGDEEAPNDNAPLSDGGDGFSFGGGGGGPFGSNPGGFGGPGYDPGTDILPLAFTPDDGSGDKGGNGGDGGKPPFFSPVGPSIAAVPEPATWALFILGFGLLGAQLRRARDTQRVPALTRPRKGRLG